MGKAASLVRPGFWYSYLSILILTKGYLKSELTTFSICLVLFYVCTVYYDSSLATCKIWETRYHNLFLWHLHQISRFSKAVFHGSFSLKSQASDLPLYQSQPISASPYYQTQPARRRISIDGGNSNPCPLWKLNPFFAFDLFPAVVIVPHFLFKTSLVFGYQFLQNANFLPTFSISLRGYHGTVAPRLL